MSAARPIIIVTGANGGVGFGICQRLLQQLCHKVPADSLPQSFVLNPPKDSGELIEYEGLTLIMACRNAKRAEAAKQKLTQKLDDYVEKLKRQSGYDGHAEKFRKNVQIDIVSIELAMMSTVFKFVEEIKAKYPYISHLIFNAGTATFNAIDWIPCIKQLCTDFVGAVTAPCFYLQSAGDLSVDGLGWVWQSNLFSHFVVFRELQPLLQRAPANLTPRVVWMSSLEASPHFYDPEDWQLKKTEHPYEATKYEIDILCTTLDHRAQLGESKGERPIRHFVTQPGICSTNVSHAIAGPVLDVFKIILFYMGRLFGSPNHTIDPFKAAIGAVHLALASISFISLMPSAHAQNGHANGHTNGHANGHTNGHTNGHSNGHANGHSNGYANGKANGHLPPLRLALKHGAETGRWGTERVGILPVKEWEQNKDIGEDLLQRCEKLYQSLKEAEKPSMDDGIDE